MTMQDVVDAINAAGFTKESFAGFLIAGKLSIEASFIDAQVRNEQAARTASNQASETRIQELQAARAALQTQIDALGS